MARLSEQEKESFLQFARGPKLPAQVPPILPIADYLRFIASLARLPHPSKPVRFAGSHWKL